MFEKAATKKDDHNHPNSLRRVDYRNENENIDIIKSHRYITELQLKEEIQRIYVLRCQAGIEQIKKVIKMLDIEISKQY